MREECVRMESVRRPLWVVGALILAAGVLLATLFLVKERGHRGLPPVLSDDLTRLQVAHSLVRQRASDDATVWRRMGERPAAAPSRTPPRADPGFEVTAIFYEADQPSCGAILRDRARRQYFVKVGQTIQGWTVTRISAEGVLLSQGGGELFVKLVARPGAAAASHSTLFRRESGLCLCSGPCPSILSSKSL